MVSSFPGLPSFPPHAAQLGRAWAPLRSPVLHMGNDERDEKSLSNFHRGWREGSFVLHRSSQNYIQLPSFFEEIHRMRLHHSISLRATAVARRSPAFHGRSVLATMTSSMGKQLSCTGPVSDGPGPGWMLCRRHQETPGAFWTRGLTFSFWTGPCKLCNQACLPKNSSNLWSWVSGSLSGLDEQREKMF